MSEAEDKNISSVSVIIPCYCCADTIRRAVNSIASQSLRPMELILVDDASIDQTLEALIGIQKEFGEGWVKIIALKQNVGAGSARNVGWDAATGDYVAFLDADDAWHPRKIELQHQFMIEHPEAALCSHAALCHARESATGEHGMTTAHSRITKPQLLVSNRFITPAVMVRRSLPYRFREGRRHMEDHLLWMEMACDGQILLKMEAVLAYTFKTPFGASGLSGELWNMEKAELENYAILWRTGRINLLAAAALWCLSGLKFLRRLARAAVMR